MAFLAKVKPIIPMTVFAYFSDEVMLFLQQKRSNLFQFYEHHRILHTPEGQRFEQQMSLNYKCNLNK